MENQIYFNKKRLSNLLKFESMLENQLTLIENYKAFEKGWEETYSFYEELFLDTQETITKVSNKIEKLEKTK